MQDDKLHGRFAALPDQKPVDPVRVALSWVRTLFFAALLAFFIIRFVVVNASVVSGSMERTIMTGDRVICSRLTYRVRDPERFDVIAFDHHQGEASWIYVKRIIGLPGERLEIINGLVYINDTPLCEPFINSRPPGSYGPFYIPDGHFFVLGDNRHASYDSKDWPDPFLAREQILGRAIFTYYPRINRIE